MIGKLAKLIAYKEAPRKTFFLLHPIKSAKVGLAYVVGRKLFKRDKGKASKPRKR